MTMARQSQAGADLQIRLRADGAQRILFKKEEVLLVLSRAIDRCHVSGAARAARPSHLTLEYARRPLNGPWLASRWRARSSRRPGRRAGLIDGEAGRAPVVCFKSIEVWDCV